MTDIDGFLNLPDDYPAVMERWGHVDSLEADYSHVMQRRSEIIDNLPSTNDAGLAAAIYEQYRDSDNELAYHYLCIAHSLHNAELAAIRAKAFAEIPASKRSRVCCGCRAEVPDDQPRTRVTHHYGHHRASMMECQQCRPIRETGYFGIAHCARCGVPFQSDTEHASSTYCSDACRKSVAPTPEAQCEQCGQAFTRKRSTAKYCGATCRQRAKRNKAASMAGAGGE